MTNRLFSQAKLDLVTGVAGHHLNGDVRLILCMTDTTVDTENDGIEDLDDFTDMDEADGSGYARLALSSATPSVAINTARDSVEWKTTDHPVFPSLGAGTRSIAGVLYYWHGATDALSIPILYAPYTTPRNPDGSNFTIELPSDKMLLEFFGAAVGTSPILLD